MVVSLNSQKIGKKSYATGRGGSLSFQVSKRPLPLYLIPYITSLFIFSLVISLVDPLWQVSEPDFSLGEMTLPKHTSPIAGTDSIILKAEAPSLLPDKRDKGLRFSEYRVREDDRYSIIARRFGITLDSLLSVNNIHDSAIHSGEILKIPTESGIYYTVKKGDTLSSISRRFSVDIDVINRSNRLISTVIHADEKIFLPGVALGKEELDKIIGDKFVIPAAGSVKNTYGQHIDPVTGLKNYNYGIDIENRKGTPVYAAKSGIVGEVSFNSYYGRVVQVNHNGSMHSLYSSLDRIIVKPGEKVKRGDLLGYMGNSGFKGGEHLQFSLFRNEEDVDTLEFIF